MIHHDHFYSDGSKCSGCQTCLELTDDEHCPLPVTVNGEGPADPEDFDHYICFCGKTDCERMNE